MQTFSFDDFVSLAVNTPAKDFLEPDMCQAVKSLINSNAINEKIKSEFNLCVEKKNYSYFAPINLFLHRSSSINISLAYLDTKSRSERYIMPNMSDSYLAVYGSKGFIVNYYESEQDGQKLRLARSVVLKEGDICLMKAGEYVGFPETNSEETLLLYIANNAESKLGEAVITKFDAKTLTASFSNSGDFQHTRAQYMAEILGGIKGEHTTKSLLKLCAYKAHFVRWSALESLLNVDFELGMKTLRQFQNDPHPHIQNAAREALKMLTLRESA